MPPSVAADIPSAQREGIKARVSAIYPDRQSFIVEFDRPVTDAQFRKRQAGFARSGDAAGLADIAHRLRVGMKVAVSADLSKTGLANITSISLLD